MIFLNDSYLKELKTEVLSVSDKKIILNKTIFYAKSGGQPGDIGHLEYNNQDINIIDTIKDNDSILHITDKKYEINKGEIVNAKINWELRYKYMKMHTALHLLCAVVPFGVTGGQIGSEKSRLDFDMSENTINIEEITKKINDLIIQDHKISYQSISISELDKKPELVRTMSVKPPRVSGKIRLVKIGNIDLQPCGGTHVRSTNEIGKIVVQKIENKGKRNRRISIRLI